MVAIRREVKKLLAEAHKCLHDQLLPQLAEAGIQIFDYAALNEKQLGIADEYFNETAFPVLTPLAFDPGRPFPHISNLSLNLAVLIRDKDGVEHFARKVPDSLPQFVPLKRPRKKSRKRPPRDETFVWLEQVISANLPALFRGMKKLPSWLRGGVVGIIYIVLTYSSYLTIVYTGTPKRFSPL